MKIMKKLECICMLEMRYYKLKWPVNHLLRE